MVSFLIFIVVPLLVVAVLGLFVWQYHFATKRGLCTRAMYDQLLKEFNVLQAKRAVNLQDVKDYLDEEYSPMVRGRLELLQEEIDLAKAGVADFVKNEELDQKVADKVKEALKKLAPTAKSAKASPVGSVVPPVDLTEVEAKQAKVMLGLKLILRYIRALDSMVISPLRAPMEAELAKLDEEKRGALHVLKEALRKANEEFRKAKANRLNPDATLSERNREAERHVATMELDDLQDQQDEFHRYLEARPVLVQQREEKFAKTEQELEAAKAALADLRVTQETETRLQELQGKLEPFEGLANAFAELAQALDPSRSSRPPAPPAQKPSRRTSRRAIPPKQPTKKPPPIRSLDETKVGLQPPPLPTETAATVADEELEYMELDPDAEPSSIDLSDLPAPKED